MYGRVPEFFRPNSRQFLHGVPQRSGHSPGFQGPIQRLRCNQMKKIPWTEFRFMFNQIIPKPFDILIWPKRKANQRKKEEEKWRWEYKNGERTCNPSRPWMELGMRRWVQHRSRSYPASKDRFDIAADEGLILPSYTLPATCTKVFKHMDQGPNIFGSGGPNNLSIGPSFWKTAFEEQSCIADDVVLNMTSISTGFLS